MDPIVAAHRANNFDTLRIVAALGVVVAHSIPLTYGPTRLDTLWAFSHGRATIGSVAIQVFFIISGYLITASYINTKNPRRFVRARVLRLVPALIVVLAVLAFIAGPLLTSLPLHEYFRSALPYRAVFGLSDHLPGVFTNNPFSSGIDGSLWTLRYEGLCYVVVFCLGLARLLRRGVVAGLFLLLLLARLHFGSHPALEFGALFAAGAVIFFLQPPLRGLIAIPCAVIWLLSLKLGGFTLISDTLGAYLVIYLGLAPGFRLPNLAAYGDLSYGVYIYAWPIQQVFGVRLSNDPSGWLINIALTLPLVLLLAFLSWHLVESPALQLKNKTLLNLL